MLSPYPGVDNRARPELAPRGFAALDPATDAERTSPEAPSPSRIFPGPFRTDRGSPALSRGKAGGGAPLEDSGLLRRTFPARTGRHPDFRAPPRSSDRAPEWH